MSIEEQLKEAILVQYKSIRAFTMDIDIPYSTIDNMLKRGVSGASVSTVIKVCNSLGIDIESLQTDEIQYKIKEAPAEAEATDEKVFQSHVQLLTDFFVKSGYIEAGGDLTDEQLKVAMSLVDFLDSYFG